jgi:hypothetical protein
MAAGFEILQQERSRLGIMERVSARKPAADRRYGRTGS